MTGPSTSVVIPTYNRAERLVRVLTSIEAQTDCQPFEVVVVSDGSTDDTDAVLATLEIDVPLRVFSQPNQGPASARNRGVREAHGDLIVFIDDDVVAGPGLVGAHQAAHRHRSKLVTIGPMLDPADHEMSPWVRWEQRMLAKQYGAMTDGRFEATARQFYTGNAAIRRDEIVAAGGFDDRFRRAEDVELAYRLADRGATFEYCADAVGFHYAERSYRAWREVAYTYGRNDIVFARDRGQTWIYGFIGDKLCEHRPPIRALVRSTLGRRRVARSVVSVLGAAGTLAARCRAPRVSSALLSGVFAVEYHRGVDDELGGSGVRGLLASRD